MTSLPKLTLIPGDGASLLIALGLQMMLYLGNKLFRTNISKLAKIKHHLGQGLGAEGSEGG